MAFKFVHNNFNVRDLDKSLQFYQEALGLAETRRIRPEDGSFEIVYLGDGQSEHLLELTWLRDWDRPYDLGDNEFHLALETHDYAAVRLRHQGGHVHLPRPQPPQPIKSVYKNRCVCTHRFFAVRYFRLGTISIQ